MATKEKSKRKAKKKTKNKKPMLTAKNADKHVLYQQSVQAPDVDAAFFARYFKRHTGRVARLFREDFCGTAVLACNWVMQHKENRAIGVDICGKTLDWGRKHNIGSLLDDRQTQRIQLIHDDVMNVRKPAVDVIVALNFSYCLFKTREMLRTYFETAHASLAAGGLLFCDAWGGAETQLEQEERREQDGFTYVWDQYRFDPVTYDATCRIHFEFDDGSSMRNAYVYHWRMWTLPEIQELMRDAGFKNVHILWEGTDRDTDEGNGVFRRIKRGDADPAWIAYVVGER